MDYCGPRGIPHWHFLGGPNRWTQHDREAALWWLIHHRQKCSSCHTRKKEWDPKQGGNLRAYEAVISRCPGCAVIEREEKELARLREAKQAPSGARIELKPLAVIKTDGDRVH